MYNTPEKKQQTTTAKSQLNESPTASENDLQTPTPTKLTAVKTFDNTSENKHLIQVVKKLANHEEGFVLYQHLWQFNEPFIMERLAKLNEITTILTVNIQDIDPDMEVTPLPTNQARKFRLPDNFSFTIYSPRKGECLIFCHSGEDIKTYWDMKIIGAKAVKHGSDITKTKEGVVTVGQFIVTGTGVPLIEIFMAQKEDDRPKMLPDEGVHEIEGFSVHCYCNDILTSSSKDTVNCYSCDSRYHQRCLTNEEKTNQTCTPCSAWNAIGWSQGNSYNTCSLDNTWQGLLLLLQESNNNRFKFTLPTDEAHELLSKCLQLCSDCKEGEAQDLWSNHLETNYKNLLINWDRGNLQNKPNDMFAAPLDIAWKPLIGAAGSSLTYEYGCSNSNCEENKKKKTQTDTINIIPPNFQVVDSIDELINIQIEGTYKHDQGDLCLKCSSGNISKTGVHLLDPKKAWFINIEGTNAGLSLADDQAKVMKTKNIFIDGIEFEPRIIVSNLGNIHFTSLLKFKGTWLAYNDMETPNMRLKPASPTNYEDWVFDHMTFIRKHE